MTNAVLRVLCTHKSEANCPFSNKRALGWICIGDNLWAKAEKTLGFLSEAGIKGERTVCVKDYKAAVHIMRTPRNRFFKGRWILRASGTLCWGWESRELFSRNLFWLLHLPKQFNAHNSNWIFEELNTKEDF